jgi:hypothetical protein
MDCAVEFIWAQNIDRNFGGTRRLTVLTLKSISSISVVSGMTFVPMADYFSIIALGEARRY